MSKLKKLTHNPRLFFYDALINIFNKDKAKRSFGMKAKVSEVNNEQQLNMPLLKYNLAAVKINLVVVDLINNNESKADILKYQCRVIEKYTDFNRVYYISKDITSLNNNYVIYDSYQSFFEQIVLRVSPKKEIFLFIDLNFFFLRYVEMSDFINLSGMPYTYITKQFKKNERLLNVMGRLFPGGSVNFSTINNYCCIDNMQLVHYHDVLKSVEDIGFYLYDFLPTVNSLIGEEHVKSTPVQYANLSYGYMEKFVWIKSVHGSKRCPLAITFNHTINNKSDFDIFLNDIVPHESILEKELFLNK